MSLFVSGLFASGLFADSLFVGMGGDPAPAGPPWRGGKPKERKINARSLVLAIDGPETPYPTYTFSGKVFRERPKHNPFKDL